MNLNRIYEDRHLLSKEAEKNFRPYRKTDLNVVEYLGLERILCLFVEQYEEETMGDCYSDLSEYTRWNKDGIDILDGCYDTYVFDDYAIGEIWMTDNGCILLDCYKLGLGDHCCLIDVVSNIDFHTECECVTFRLD